MKKRLLSAFMALALCLTLLPTAALAAEADAPEGGTIVQEEQQEKAPAAESPAVSEQAAGAVAEVDGTTYSDLIAAFDAAHTLKGVLSNMGLTPLYDCVSAIVEPLREGRFDDTAEEYARLLVRRAELSALLGE